jgi:hypothetical protein
MAHAINLVEQVVGLLTIISRADAPLGTTGRLSYWNAVCVCGSRMVVRSDDWRAGRKTSCPDCRAEHHRRVVTQVIWDGSAQTKFGMQ